MKILILIIITLFCFAACVTTSPQKPKRSEPVENTYARYSYESEIDPVDLFLWELVQSRPFTHQTSGIMYDIYAKNQNLDADFLYANYIVSQNGIMSYCLVTNNGTLFAYNIDLSNGEVVYRYTPSLCCEFKDDIEEVFGIEVEIPLGA